MTTGRLPDFVIVGAQRCGTTSLYRYLDGHAGVFMAATKELHFFDRHFAQGLGWYRAQFESARTDQLAGEATPRYMSDGLAIERLATAVPDARLVAILRNPVDRAYSHYWMERARGREQLSFEDAVAAEEARDDPEVLPAYLGQGRYLRQLQRITDRFPREQLLVLLFDDLCRDAAATFSGLCRFLGVDDRITPPVVGRRVNEFVSFRSLWLRRLTKLVPPSVPVLSRGLGRLNSRSGDAYPPLDPTTRAELVGRFDADNRALAQWLGRDLGIWNQAHTPSQGDPA